MGTKICAVCGQNLPLSSFRKTRYGDHMKVCSDCCAKKSRITRAARYSENRGEIITMQILTGRHVERLWM